MREVPLIALCGPSGVGKTAISFTLWDKFDLKPVVSYTSRPQREGEVDGRDYRFRTKEWMEENRSWFGTDWRTFNGNHYGATDEDLRNLDVIVINPDDVTMLREMGLPMFFIWVNGPVRTPRERKDDIVWKPEYVGEVNHVLNNHDGRSLDWCANEVYFVRKLITNQG